MRIYVYVVRMRPINLLPLMPCVERLRHERVVFDIMINVHQHSVFRSIATSIDAYVTYWLGN